MRSVEFTDHLVDDIEQLLPVADVRHQRLVLRFGGVPIHAMHCRIVEAILHRAPGVAEHLCPLSRTIYLHAHAKADTATRSLASTCSAASGRGCACGAHAGTERNRINTVALAKEKRAAIAR